MSKLDTHSGGLTVKRKSLFWESASYNLYLPYSSNLGFSGGVKFTADARLEELEVALTFDSPCCNSPFTQVPFTDQGRSRTLCRECWDVSYVTERIDTSNYARGHGALFARGSDFTAQLPDWTAFVYEVVTDASVLEAMLATDSFVTPMMQLYSELHLLMLPLARDSGNHDDGSDFSKHVIEGNKTILLGLINQFLAGEACNER